MSEWTEARLFNCPCSVDKIKKNARTVCEMTAAPSPTGCSAHGEVEVDSSLRFVFSLRAQQSV